MFRQYVLVFKILFVLYVGMGSVLCYSQSECPTVHVKISGTKDKIIFDQMVPVHVYAQHKNAIKEVNQRMQTQKTWERADDMQTIIVWPVILLSATSQTCKSWSERTQALLWGFLLVYNVGRILSFFKLQEYKHTTEKNVQHVADELHLDVLKELRSRHA